MVNHLSPSMKLPNRKRSHSKHLDGALLPVEDSKSRRTSPSPFLAGPSTPPTISSGYDPMLGEGYFDLTLSVYKFTTYLPLFLSLKRLIRYVPLHLKISN